MSNNTTKGSLLTSSLDFEGLDDFSPSFGTSTLPDALSESVLDSKPKPSAPAVKTEEIIRKKPQAAALISKPEPVKRAPERTRSVEKKRTQVVRKQDRFALYVAGIVLLGLIGISFGIYEIKFANHNSAGLSYIELPQNVINVDGLVARMQATIQVDTGDAGWLQDNKAQLDGSFKKAAVALDLEALRNPENIPAAQLELQKRINQELKTDKVQAVLLTEFLIQEHRNE